MKIVFCIHGCATKPIGGHKVLYECANRLYDRGHDVTIVFPSYDNLYQLHLPASIRVFICKVLTDWIHYMPKWFKFRQGIKRKTVMDYNEKYFPDGDIVIATALETAKPVFDLPARCGKKVYFIQDYEIWDNSEETVCESYALGMQNITISNWLKDIVQKYSPTLVKCIPNAIDVDVFKYVVPIEKRDKYRVGLLYHDGEHKGLRYAFDALRVLHDRYPELRVEMFGATTPSEELPEWMHFYYRLNQTELCELYNRCSIFLCATVEEGFGLTGAESMACGCAFVSTSYKGVHEYTIDGETALLSPVKDSAALAENVSNLFENDELRYKLSLNGVKAIRERSWDRFIDALEGTFT